MIGKTSFPDRSSTAAWTISRTIWCQHVSSGQSTGRVCLIVRFLEPACSLHPRQRTACKGPTVGFATGEMVWIRDPGSEALQPFWLGRELSAMLSGAQPGDPAPATLSPQARRILIAANLLVPDDYGFQRRQRWAEIVSVTGPQFQAQGYAPVGRLLHPFHIAALRRHYRHQLRTGKLRRQPEPAPLCLLQRPGSSLLSSTANRGRLRICRRAGKAFLCLSGFVPAGGHPSETHRPRTV